MRVSQRLDYTLRMLVALASEARGSRVALGELADSLGLPRRFSEQQVSVLAKRGIVSCRPGPRGGCRLEVPATALTVADVVEAIEGEALDVPHTAGSATAEMWERVAGEVTAALRGVTIADLARRQAELDRLTAPMYHI